MDFLNVPNSLENICYIIDPSLLNPQLLCSLVYIQHEVLLTFYQLHEPFCQNG